MIIAIGSENPVKIKAVKGAFKKVFSKKKLTFKFAKVPSGISDQPMSDLEGIEGARNRAKRVLEKFKADFGIGLEGSIQKIGKDWFNGPWCVIVDKMGREGIAAGAKIHVAPKFLKLIKKGYELGIANDILTGRKNTKQKEGHFGIMTKGILGREKIYKDAVISALGRWLRKDFYE
ncbi:MAG: inosine/xanthosine triphosphatase [Patescibacteria group bacterium]|nr:inosine/xanthosine triphosphatase [Patescibacteria group bacterium]